CRNSRRKLQALSNPSRASTPKAAPGDESNDSKRTPGTSPQAAETAHENRPASSAAPASALSVSAACQQRFVRTTPPARLASSHSLESAMAHSDRIFHPME